MSTYENYERFTKMWTQPYVPVHERKEWELPQLEIPPGLNKTTASLVVRFANALAAKLHAAQVKYGWEDDWASPEWIGACQRQLINHLTKGDPRDVAAYAAFLWHHGERTVMPKIRRLPRGYAAVRKDVLAYLHGEAGEFKPPAVKPGERPRPYWWRTILRNGTKS